MDKSLGKALSICTTSSKHSSPFPHRLGSSAGFAQPTASGPLLSALPSIDPSPSPFSGCGYSSGSFPESGLLPTGSSRLHGPTSAAPELQPPSSFTLGAKGASVQTVSIWKAAPPALWLPPPSLLPEAGSGAGWWSSTVQRLMAEVLSPGTQRASRGLRVGPASPAQSHGCNGLFCPSPALPRPSSCIPWQGEASRGLEGAFARTRRFYEKKESSSLRKNR